MPKTLVKAKLKSATKSISSKSVVAKKATSLSPAIKISASRKPLVSSAMVQAVASANAAAAKPLSATAASMLSAGLTSFSAEAAALASTEVRPEIRTPSKSIREKITEKMREKRSAGGAGLGPVDFKVGDHAVYPSYGVGTVVAIETKEIMGSRCDFYVVMIRDTGMKVMVPKNNVSSVGLRPVISKQEASKVIEILKATEVRIDNQTWNRRYREYMEKIKTGSVYEIAEVLRDLFLLKVDKELSYGERNMLDTARKLLMKELSLAVDHEELVKEDEVRQIFGL